MLISPALVQRLPEQSFAHPSRDAGHRSHGGWRDALVPAPSRSPLMQPILVV